MSDYKQTIERGLAQFNRQYGAHTLAIIPMNAEAFEALYDKATGGDREAQDQLMAIAQWTQVADVAASHNDNPHCISCGGRIAKGRPGEGDVLAFAVLMPREETDRSVGVVSPICYRCENKSFDEILHAAIASIEAQTGNRVEMVQ